MSGNQKHVRFITEALRKSIIPIASALALFIFYGTYITQVRSTVDIDWNNIIEKGFFIIAIIIVIYWIKVLAVAALHWYTVNISEKTASTIDEEFIPLFKKLISILIWAIGLIIILSYLGLNIAALITTLGVVSLAVALAAQDTISNVIAGFLIMIDRPFRVGDKIKLPSGEKVDVLWIGNRRSKFRAEDGSIIIVPNLDLSKSRIVNYTYGER